MIIHILVYVMYLTNLFSKLLANRLPLVLPKIISHLESAFAHDNVVIAHEALSLLIKNGKVWDIWLSNRTWKKHMIGWNRIFSRNALLIKVFLIHG